MRFPHIALTGKARAGKDTAGAFLVEHAGYTRVSFADGVREVALAIDPIVYTDPHGVHARLADVVRVVGWHEAKADPEVRRLLQRIGTEAGRDIFGPTLWTDLALRKVADVEGPLVFTDVRFPSEVEAARALGAVLVRLERPGAGAGDHSSETALDGYPVDHVITNDSTLTVLRTAVANIALGGAP